MNDGDMHNEERDRFAKVSSTSIIEELGQVNYIFSDKTGTLTRNVMEFKLMYVGNTMYGKSERSGNSEGRARNAQEIDHTYGYQDWN